MSIDSDKDYRLTKEAEIFEIIFQYFENELISDADKKAAAIMFATYFILKATDDRLEGLDMLEQVKIDYVNLKWK